MMKRAALSSVLVTAVVATGACDPDAVEVPTLFELVEVSTIAARADGLRGPRDLDFNPEVPGELWVVSRDDDSMLTIRETGTDAQTVLRRKDPYALHFMEESSSISFSTGMKFATCGESRNTYDDQVEGNDFMGPALWSADDAIFAKTNPAAVADNGFDLGSHLDMMHETPLCMGIAWVDENIYFVYEGLTGTIARYDFKTDHGPGFDFHGDGTVERFEDVDVTMVDDIPSHLAFDKNSGLLYVADTGNSRIAVMDASSAAQVRSFRGFETSVQVLNGAGWSTLVRGADVGIEKPSGIALRNGLLFVTDAATSDIYAFDLDGNLVDQIGLNVDADSLFGLRVNPEGDSLYVVDFQGDRVLRLQGLTFPE